MIQRSVSAGIRACLVATLIAMPALAVPGINADSTQIVALLSLLGALLVFVEYSATYPSLVDFRSAPPFNRLRFATLFLTVLMMTQIQQALLGNNPIGTALLGVARYFGAALDFPFSPVRLVLLMLPVDTPAAVLDNVRAFAGLAYAMSLATIALFFAAVRFLDWPLNSGAFNVLTNLPLFDPTSGGDVLTRMKRDSTVNLVLGFLLPFLMPAVLNAVSPVIDPRTLVSPQTLIWTICIWAFIPASMFMRGVAFRRISGMIEEKRRRTYAQHGDPEDALQAA